MKTITINKALMQIEEALKQPNLDYVMVQPNEKGDLSVFVNIEIPDLDDKEALGDED